MDFLVFFTIIEDDFMVLVYEEFEVTLKDFKQNYPLD